MSFLLACEFRDHTQVARRFRVQWKEQLSLTLTVSEVCRLRR